MVWNRRTGAPIHNAIVWQDRRGEPLCAQLRAQGLAETIRHSTGLVVDAYFSATKIRWILDHVSGAHIAAAHGELAFGTVDSWLLWKLTGGRVHATDVSNASRTMLFDIRHNVWDHELLKAAARARQPAARRCTPAAMSSARPMPALLGAAIPVAGIAGDQQSALFGQACFTAGLAKNTYGTGCFMLMHTGDKFRISENGLITTAAAQADSRAASTRSKAACSSAARWCSGCATACNAIKASSEVQALAESVPDAGGVMFVPAFTGLGAPYWNANARGTITGLTPRQHHGATSRARRWRASPSRARRCCRR